MDHKIRISPHNIALFLDTSSFPAMSSPTLAVSPSQLASLPFYRRRMGDAVGQAKLPQSQVTELEPGASSLDFSPGPCSLTTQLGRKS